MNLEKPYSLYELTGPETHKKIYVITKDLVIYHVRTEGCGDSSLRLGMFIDGENSVEIDYLKRALQGDELNIYSKRIKTMDEEELFLELL
jgi:hypothetical protein